jgi:hypothetical protein
MVVTTMLNPKWILHLCEKYCNVGLPNFGPFLGASQCLFLEKESQQGKVHDKSRCSMTLKECASRTKEYKTLRTKDSKTKSRDQQHDNRIIIIKRYSDQGMEMHVCLEIESEYKSSIQWYNILPYSFISFLFFLPPESLVMSSLDCFFF